MKYLEISWFAGNLLTKYLTSDVVISQTHLYKIYLQNIKVCLETEINSSWVLILVLDWNRFGTEFLQMNWILYGTAVEHQKSNGRKLVRTNWNRNVSICFLTKRNLFANLFLIKFNGSKNPNGNFLYISKKISHKTFLGVTVYVFKYFYNS